MIDQPTTTFARRLQEIRLARGLTQGELAQLARPRLDVPVTGTTIAKIESGRRKVKVDEAVVFARILQATVEDFFCEDTPITDRRAAVLRQLADARVDEARIERDLDQVRERITRLQRDLDDLLDE